MKGHKDSDNLVVLLGGHDLEMKEIKKMLKGRKVEDNDLQWDNAPLSSYASVFNDKNLFVGIELKKDCPPPKHYIEIDHHNDKKNLPSSIEQVAELIGVTLNRDQLLAAANDKGYIRALEAMGATEEEIKKVRYEDKKEQGVTEEDERLADESIQSHSFKIGKVIVVESLTPRFSTITDKLYPYEELLIRYQQSFTYYGRKSADLAERYQSLIKKDKAHSGGTEPSYFDLDARKGTLEEANSIYSEVINYIKAMETKSYHVFMFPFRWEIEQTETNKKKISEHHKLSKEHFKNQSRTHSFPKWIEFKNLQPENKCKWTQDTIIKMQEDPIEEYNTRNYYHKFVHPIIYGEDAENFEIQHYKRIAGVGKELQYVIHTNEREKNNAGPYTLLLNELTLDMFSTGVGILSFHLINTEYLEFNDILKINHFGRRIFPPFLSKMNGVEGTINFGELAEKISIVGLEGEDDRYLEDFRGYDPTQYWTPSKIIKNLLLDFHSALKPEPVVDDRMFTMCWTFSDQMGFSIKNKYTKWIKSDDWHKYLFIDTNRSTCQNDEMQEQLLKNHTYQRWQKDGTLYGITRYSMMVISKDNWFPRNILLTHFRTIYFKMVMITLLQRASILRFSDEVTELNYIIHEDDLVKSFEKLDDFYKAYMQFINKIYQQEISAQEQAIEIYDMLQQHLKIEKQSKELKEEIKELFTYVNMQKTEKINENMRWLNKLIAIVVVPTFLFNLLNNRFFNKLEVRQTIIGYGLKLDSAVFLTLIVFCSWLTIYALQNYQKRTLFRIKGKYLLFYLGGIVLVYLLLFQYFIGK